MVRFGLGGDSSTESTDESVTSDESDELGSGSGKLGTRFQAPQLKRPATRQESSSHSDQSESEDGEDFDVSEAPPAEEAPPPPSFGDSLGQDYQRMLLLQGRGKALRGDEFAGTFYDKMEEDPFAAVTRAAKAHKASPLAPSKFAQPLFPSAPLSSPPAIEIESPLHVEPQSPKPFIPEYLPTAMPAHPSGLPLPFIPLNRSLVADQIQEQKLEVRPNLDAGIHMGRSFRIGWGPNGSLVLPRKPNSDYHSLVTISRVPLGDLSTERHLNMLKSHFKNSASDVACSTCRRLHQKLTQSRDPVEESAWKEQLQSHKERSYQKTEECAFSTFQLRQPNSHTEENIEIEQSKHPNDAFNYRASIWGLVKTLWGTHSHLDGISISPSQLSPTQNNLCRQFTINEWFKSVTRQEHTSDSQLDDHGLMFENLSKKQIKEAVDIAVRTQDLRFGLLLSQAASLNPKFQRHIKDQIAQWKVTNRLDALGENRKRLYYLLSGQVSEVIQHLDWKRALAMHMWYGHNTALGGIQLALGTSLHYYQADFEKNKAQKPFPPHITSNPKALTYIRQEPAYDVTYHLLHMYANPMRTSLSDALAASTLTSNPLDYGLSWHLFSVLDAFGVIPKKRDDPRLEYNLTLSYASVLEFLGLWEWAIYLYLNLPSSDVIYLREGAIREILNRQIPSIDEEKTEFLIKQLGIPKEWIQAAQGSYECYKSNYSAAVKCFLESEQWELANTTLQYIAWPQLLSEFNSPDGNGFETPLWDFLEQLETNYPQAITEQSSFWLIYSFLNIQKILSLPPGARMDDDDLIPRVKSLIQRIDELLKIRTTRADKGPDRRANLTTCNVQNVCLDLMSSSLNRALQKTRIQ